MLEGELWLLSLCPSGHGMRSPCRSFFSAPPCLSHSAAGSVHALVWPAQTLTPPEGNLQPPEGNLVLSSVQSLSCVRLRPRGLQHTRLPCPSPTPGACSNSCPLSQQCHPTISSSLEMEMATHSSVLAWRSTGTGEPGGLPSMWSHRVGHD